MGLPVMEDDPYLQFQPGFATTLPIQILLTGITLTLLVILLIHLLCESPNLHPIGRCVAPKGHVWKCGATDTQSQHSTTTPSRPSTTASSWRLSLPCCSVSLCAPLSSYNTWETRQIGGHIRSTTYLSMCLSRNGTRQRTSPGRRFWPSAMASQMYALPKGVSDSRSHISNSSHFSIPRAPRRVSSS